MKRFFLALSFLTTLPVRLREVPRPGDLGFAAVWFPWVGLVLGLLLGIANFLLGQILPALLASALVVAVWAALTGGLHLDGLADCCDGLLASVPRERRLEILRDPRLGSFGGVGLGLFLILKVSALASISQPGIAIPAQSLALLLAPVLARWLILPAGRQPMARPGGLGAEFSIGLKTRDLFLGGLLPLALAILAGWQGLLAVGLALLVVFGAVRLARSRLGGLTGDVLGLIVELSELAVLLAFAVRI